MTRQAVCSNPDCVLPASLSSINNLQAVQQACMGAAHAEQHRGSSSSFSRSSTVPTCLLPEPLS